MISMILRILSLQIMLLIGISASMLKADPIGQDSVIVSGFVINKSNDEGLSVRITVKNANDFSIVASLESQKGSGSYHHRLKKGAYYFVIEQAGFDLYNKLFLFKEGEKRIQKDIYLEPISVNELLGIAIEQPKEKSKKEKSNEVKSISKSKKINVSKKEEEASVDEDIIADFEEVTSKNPVSSTRKSNKSENTSTNELKEVENAMEAEEVLIDNDVKPLSKSSSKVSEQDILQDEVFEELDALISSVDISLDQSKLSLNMKIENGCQHLDIPVKFSAGMHAIDNDIASSLQPVLSFLKSNPEVRLEIRGFSDNGFVDEFQMNLAKMRAKAVKFYFTTKNINGERLKAIPFPTKAIELMIASKKEHRANHLVEFRIIGNEEEESSLNERLSVSFKAKEYILSAEDLVGPNEKSEDKRDIKISKTSQAQIKDVADNRTNIESSSDLVPDIQIDSVENISSKKMDYKVSDSIALDLNPNDNNLESDIDFSGQNELEQVTSESLNINSERQSREEESLNEDNVISAFDKFMKEIEDINTKKIFFDRKSAEIRGIEKECLDSVFQFLMEHPKIEIKITGYASKKEGKKKFMNFAIDRTNNVTNYLIKKGIKKSRVKAKTGGVYNKKGDGSIIVEDELRVEFYVEPLKDRKTIKPRNEKLAPNLKVRKEGDSIEGINVVSDQSSENKYDENRNEADHIESPNLKSESDYFNYLLNEKSDVIKQGLVYKVQIGAYNEPQPKSSKLFKKVKNPEMRNSDDGMVRYYSGSYKTLELAYEHQKKLRKKGVKDAFVIAFLNERRIYMRDLAKLL